MYHITRFLLIAIFFLVGCEHTQDLTRLEEQKLPIQTSFKVTDFEPATDCKSCHPIHFKEWSGSMHAYALKDPVWFSLQKKEQAHFSAEGKELGQFCIMCHSPVAFLTDAIEEPSSFDISDTSKYAPQIQEGIGCSFCHATTHFSPTTDAYPAIGETDVIKFFLNTGDVKYGTVRNPISNNFHESEYHPDYDNSEFCQGCHNLTIDGQDAEMTFTEWSGTAFEAMGVECQSCHMATYAGYAVDKDQFPEAPYRENLHNHTFAGIDQALTSFREEASQITAIQSLLKSAAEMNFSSALPDSLTNGETLELSILVTNSSGHNLPTGTTFSRQLWIEVTALAGGDTVYRSGHQNDEDDLYDFHIDPNGVEDPDLTLFRTVLYNAEGDSGLRQVAVERFVRKTDTTIPVQGSRKVLYSFSVPDDSQGNLDLTVRLRFRALPPFFVREFAPGIEGLTLNIFNIAELTETIPIRSSQ